MNIKSFFLPATLWLAAFVCALFPLNDYQLELFALYIIVLFGWSCVMLLRDMEKGWEIARSPVLWVAGAFWGLFFISAFWSEIKPISLISVCFFSAMPLTFFIGVLAGKDEYFARIIKVLAIIFAILSVWAIVQFFFLNSYFWGQARHPMGDPSSLGSLFSLALFCSLGWIVSDRPAKERKFAVALAILLVCGIISTVARGPIFAFVPGAILFFIVLWPQVKQRWKSVLIVILGAGIFYGITLTGIQHRIKLDIGDRLAGTFSSNLDAASGNRVKLWTATIEMIKDRPLLGTGAGTFAQYYPEYRLSTNADTSYMAHNDPLQFWVELGILGPILFYAFCFVAAWRSFSSLGKLREGNDRVLVAAIFAALASMVVGSHVGFNHYNLSILMVTGFLLSVWFKTSGKVLDEPKRFFIMPDNVPVAANKALIALPFVMMGWLALSILSGEMYANRAQRALFEENMEKFAQDINMSGRVSMGLNSKSYLLAVNVPITILDQQKNDLSLDEQKKLYDQTVGYMQSVLAINPRTATAYYYLAKVQTMVASSVIPDETPTAEEYYKRALELDQLHLGSRMDLYRLYKQQGKSNDELLAVLTPGENFFYNMTVALDYYAELSKMYLETKNYVKAEEIAGKLDEFKKRSDFSWQRQNTSIPEAIIRGDGVLLGH